MSETELAGHRLAKDAPRRLLVVTKGRIMWLGSFAVLAVAGSAVPILAIAFAFAGCGGALLPHPSPGMGYAYQLVTDPVQEMWRKWRHGGTYYTTRLRTKPGIKSAPFDSDLVYVPIDSPSGGTLPVLASRTTNQDTFWLLFEPAHDAPYMDDLERAMWNSHFTSLTNRLSSLGVKQFSALIHRLPTNVHTIGESLGTRVHTDAFSDTPALERKHLRRLFDNMTSKLDALARLNTQTVTVLALTMPREVAWNKSRRPESLDQRVFEATPINHILDATIQELSAMHITARIPRPVEMTALMRTVLNPVKSDQIYEIERHDRTAGGDIMQCATVKRGPWPDEVQVANDYSFLDDTYHRVLRVKSHGPHEKIAPGFFDFLWRAPVHNGWAGSAFTVTLVPLKGDRYWAQKRRNLKVVGLQEKGLPTPADQMALAQVQTELEELSFTSGTDQALFDTYVRVSAQTIDDLDAQTKAIENAWAMEGMLIERVRLGLRQVPALLTTLGLDHGSP